MWTWSSWFCIRLVLGNKRLNPCANAACFIRVLLTRWFSAFLVLIHEQWRIWNNFYVKKENARNFFFFVFLKSLDVINTINYFSSLRRLVVIGTWRIRDGCRGYHCLRRDEKCWNDVAWKTPDSVIRLRFCS